MTENLSKKVMKLSFSISIFSFILAFVFPLLFAVNSQSQELHFSTGLFRDGGGGIFEESIAGGYFNTSLLSEKRIKIFGHNLAGTKLSVLLNEKTIINEFQFLKNNEEIKIISMPGPVYLEFRWDEKLFHYQKDDIYSHIYFEEVEILESRYFKYLIFLSGIFGFFYLILNIKEIDNLPFLTWKSSISIFILFFSIYTYFYYNNKVGIVGDEPSYLLLAESLAYDGDLDLENQLNQPSLGPWQKKNHSDNHNFLLNGNLRPIHYPGLSYYLALGFLMEKWGLQTSPIIVAKFQIIIFTAFISFYIFQLCHSNFRNRAVLALCFIMLISLPYSFYSFQLYPESIAQGIIFILFSWIFFNFQSFIIRNLILVCLILILPFFHIKYSLYSIVFGIVFLYHVRNSHTEMIIYFLIFILGSTTFLFYNYIGFGSIWGGYSGNDINTEKLFLKQMSYLYDSEKGIFFLNPLLFYSLCGLIYLFGEKQKLAWASLGLILIGYFPNLIHTATWLGACPYGRYWVTSYPILTFISLYTFSKILSQEPKFNLNKLLFAIIIIFYSIQMVAFLKLPEYFYTSFEKNKIAAYMINTYINIDISRLYPSFQGIQDFKYFQYTEYSISIIFWISLHLLIVYSFMRFLRSE